MVKNNEAIATLLIPVYVPFTNSLKQSLMGYIRIFLEDLDIISINIIGLSRRFVKLKLIGKDSQVGKKFLEKELGTLISWEDLRRQAVFRGFVRRITDRSLIIDIGISSNNEQFYVAIDFVSFVSSIIRRKLETIVNREILTLFGIREYFPIYVRISKNASIDEEKRIVEAELSVKSAKLFNSWIKSRLDRLIIYGSTRTQIEKAIKKSGHLRDIVSVERLGFLEHALVCKWSTNAKGLIPELGPFLPHAIFAPFYPRKIKKMISKM